MTLEEHLADPKDLMREVLRMIEVWHTFTPPDNGYGAEDVQYMRDVLNLARKYSR